MDNIIKWMLQEDELTAYSSAFESKVQCTLNMDGKGTISVERTRSRLLPIRR